MVGHDGAVDGELGNSSVRVEIDAAAGGGGAPLPDTPGGGRSRLPLLGGLLALIVALGLVAVALPDRDDPLPGGPELAAALDRSPGVGRWVRYEKCTAPLSAGISEEWLDGAFQLFTDRGMRVEGDEFTFCTCR